MRIDSIGDVCINDWKESTRAIIKFSEEDGHNKLLVDSRTQTSAPSPVEILNFIKTWPDHIIVAIVTTEKTREAEEFVETTGVNRGKTIRAFDKYEEAIEWLQSQ